MSEKISLDSSEFLIFHLIEENKKENKALETSGATVVTPDVN